MCTQFDRLMAEARVSLFAAKIEPAAVLDHKISFFSSCQAVKLMMMLVDTC